MTLQPSTIKQTVLGWNIMFGGSKSQAELAFLCGKFLQHLNHIYSDAEFVIAAGLVERETQFFPTVKQMLDCRESVQQIRQEQIGDMTLKALPEETGNYTIEELEQNSARLKNIAEMLSGNMSMKDAIAANEKLVKYARQ